MSDVAVELGSWRGVQLPAPAGDRPEDEHALREAAVDAVVSASSVTVPAPLVRGRAVTLWRATSDDLRRGGVKPAAYLRALGKDEPRFLAEDAEPQARAAIERELVLLAIAQAEGIDGDDDEARMRAAVDVVVEHARLV